MPTATSSRSLEFREQLSRRVMVADGALGTMLYARGAFINRCFDEMNLSAPDIVRHIHQDYVELLTRRNLHRLEPILYQCHLVSALLQEA